MKINFKATLFFALTAISNNIQATEPVDICIDKIDQIIDHLPQNGLTLAVLDYDQTISSKEGGHDLREEGTKGTSATLQKLYQKGIQVIILTARNSKVPAKSMSNSKDISSAEISTRPILASLGNDWLQNGGLKTNGLLRIEADNNTGQPLIAYRHIVYTGNNTPKGEALVRLIDQNKLKRKPVNIIFVDNEKYNTQNVYDVFKERPENVFIFHYPNGTEANCETQK